MLRLTDHHGTQVLGVVITRSPFSALEKGNAVKVLGINAHMDFKVVGLADSLVDKGTGVATIGPSNQLAKDPAIGGGAKTTLVPGSHHKGSAATTSAIASQSYIMGVRLGKRSAGIPEVWHNTWRKVMRSLPPWENSGQ